MGGRIGIRCPKCDYQFPTSLCESCGAENLRESSYCCRCGAELVEEETPIDWEGRRLCSDGMCIGVINEQGVCNVCGKAYTGEPE
jgi:hypothetical protein